MTETTIARSRKKLPVDMFNGGKSKLEAPVSEDSVGLRSLQFLNAVRALRDGNFLYSVAGGLVGN